MSSLSGYVYVDANNNGVLNSGETPIGNVAVTLTGTNIYGVAVSRNATTNSLGYYVFSGLNASNAAGYRLSETQPAGYLDGKDAIGSQGGTTGNDVLTTVFLNTNISGINNNFGELPSNYTKFYVVNSASTDRTFEYKPDGGLVESYPINSGNTQPRGVATTIAGDRVWVVDANRNVYVYNTSGILQGSWTASGLPAGAIVEDITVFGTNVWIVDANTDRVYRYANAATQLSGTLSPASNFLLNTSLGNTNPKGLVTDGSSIWVVNDSTTDKVFKYSVNGTYLGNWTIAAANTAPTGITINPADVSDLWIVDSAGCKVYRYAAAATRVAGSQSSASVFVLASGNTCAQGIADPPPQDASSVVAEQSSVALTKNSMATRILNRFANLFSLSTRKQADVVSSDGAGNQISRAAATLASDAAVTGTRSRKDSLSNSTNRSDSTDSSDSLTNRQFLMWHTSAFSHDENVDSLFADWGNDPLSLLSASRRQMA